jgi:hypothetical protein
MRRHHPTTATGLRRKGIVLARPIAAACLLGSIAFLLPASVSAQALVVRVRDIAKGVADAGVTVLYQGSPLDRAVTDAQGVARVAGLAVGTYSLRVEAIGYTPQTLDDVRLVAGEVRAVEVVLEPQPVALEGLTVEAGRIQIQRENTEFSTQVAERTIQLLPVTHSAVDLVALTPGARPGNVWGGANFQANNYRIDGVAANNPGMGGSLLQPNVNWIERVDVRGLGAGAEFGGFQGGLIDVVTKRGGNLLQGSFRSSYQNDALASTNLVDTEIGREVAQRVDLEAEVRGPVLRDQLFYYLSAKRVQQNSQALNHVRSLEDRYAPFQEERAENQLFGKLTWSPGPRHLIEVSGAFTDTRADNFETTGYEGAGATHRYTSPTTLLNASLTETLGDWGTFELRANHFSRDERFDPYQGTDVPGIRTFALTPPYTAFGNAPFTLRSAPSSTSANAQLSFNLPTGPLTHTIKVGGEITRGSFLDRRIRNGGMTWLPANTSAFDPTDPDTWHTSSSQWVASQWGGEVHLDADVANEAVYVQTALDLGSRVALTPGIRWGRWTGWMTPTSGQRFQAVQATGWDPRIGVSVDLTGDGTLVAKGHWGRYHQSLISQMFDRVGGSDVFTNEEFWYYTRGDLADPTTTFSGAERDALALSNDFRFDAQEVLNETGPVRDYRQPYIDQWLVGLEKQVGDWLKFEALYTRRANRDMVALVDLNRASNYTVFEDVRLFGPGNNIVAFSGGSVYLQELWVPNYTLVERIRCKARGDCPDALPVPGMTAADTLGLTWDPDYVLTTAPDARRTFGQLQLSMEIQKPLWGMSLSWVRTDLKGNLDNVSGYTDPTSYDAGPYVRVNEAVNAYGTLENFADREWKMSIWGILPWDLRGGAFFVHQSGDHYSPQLRLYGLGFFHYKVGTGALVRGNNGGLSFTTEHPGQEVDYALLAPLEGHEIYVGPRGRPAIPSRSSLDVRVERMFDYGGRPFSVSVDIFNLFRNRAVTKVNTMVNNGPDYGFKVSDSLFSPGILPNQYFKAPQERVPPRTLRLGAAFYF